MEAPHGRLYIRPARTTSRLSIAGFMEKGLEAELGDELSCGKYDYMTGFDAAIHAAFLQPKIQNCIIHQLRSSCKYVSCKDLKALMVDLKAIYTAVDEHFGGCLRFMFSPHGRMHSCFENH